MRKNCNGISKSIFKPLIHRLLPTRRLNRIHERLGPTEHGPRWVTPAELIHGMVFHVLQGAGTLAQHVKRLTGKKITDGALSQRRVAMPWTIFEEIMGVALGWGVECALRGSRRFRTLAPSSRRPFCRGFDAISGEQGSELCVKN
jgi:hypothetical protein